MLKFEAYYRESVSHSQTETLRVRLVNIFYYLEDNTIAVFEPKVVNSGLNQGKVLRRQAIEREDEIGRYYHWKDLNLDIDITMYGIQYHITNCDEWTKNFLLDNGIELSNPGVVPLDSYSEQKRFTKKFQEPTFKTHSQKDKLWKFLNYDRQVLRFYCQLKESTTESRPVVLQYYLVDDTLELREVQQTNTGRDPYPILLRRQRAPKMRITSYLPTTDQLEFFSPHDFSLGVALDIVGRQVLLCDCDEFTREYYRRNFNDREFIPITIVKEAKYYPKPVTPPYNGFGSPEDSLQSCLSLKPKPPRKNLEKFFREYQALRFYAVLENPPLPIDKTRKFVFTYYLTDDTIAISELTVPNSGIMGGKFLKRGKLLKPGSDLTKPDYYSADDFAVGSTIKTAGRTFHIIEADKVAQEYFQCSLFDL